MRQFLFLLFGVLGAWRAQAIELHVAVWQGAAPYHVEVHGKWQGPCVDIYRALEAYEPRLRFVIDGEAMPMNRVQYELLGGRSDIVCGFRKTPERESAGFQYLSKPVDISAYQLAVRADDNVSVDSWDDVKKLGENGVVLLLQGHGEIEKLKTLGIRIDSSAPSAEQNLIKLAGGRARFFYHRASYFKSKKFLTENHKKIKVLPTLFHPAPAYIAAGRRVSPGTLNMLNHAFNKLVASGELDKIFKENAFE